MLGYNNDIMETVLIDPDPSKNSVITIITFFLFKFLYFFFY